MTFQPESGLVHQDLPQLLTYPMPWIRVAPNAPYFITEDGKDWTPVGQNDAVTWPDLAGLFRRRNVDAVRQYLHMLSQHGVTCLRLMLEYCHGENRYLEKPVGRMQPSMVQLWDDLFVLCEQYGLRILLTPFDTFWMKKRWRHHPYNKSNGGPCAKRSHWLLCAHTRQAIRQRLLYATQRWGGSGALFAWDLWNEIHPAHAGNRVDILNEFITDISTLLREEELRLYGRAHPQTVSVFAPALYKVPALAASIFRHPQLHFASIHLYEKNTIDHPKNTIDAAVSAGRLTREALAHIQGARPFFDSEHGPIHTFKDRKKTLPALFDDEYFRHMQWAHLASGGVGGGMRWPNRHPHTLTAGMRRAQHSLAGFLRLVSWQRFDRINLNAEIIVSEKVFSVFGCGSKTQAIVYLLRTVNRSKRGIAGKAAPITVKVQVPGLQWGRYQVVAWQTTGTVPGPVLEVDYQCGSFFCFCTPPVALDAAFVIRLIVP